MKALIKTVEDNIGCYNFIDIINVTDLIFSKFFSPNGEVNYKWEIDGIYKYTNAMVEYLIGMVRF